MISPEAGPSVEVEVAATLKCCGARARVLSTQEFAADPQPELCGVRSGCGRRACAGKAGPGLCARREPCPPAEDLARSGKNGAYLFIYLFLFSRNWTFSELAVARCPALCGRSRSWRAGSLRFPVAGQRVPRVRTLAGIAAHPRVCAHCWRPTRRALVPDLTLPSRVRLGRALRCWAFRGAKTCTAACVSRARDCPSPRVGQRPGLARDSRVSVSARLQPAWRLRGRGPAGTRAPGTTPGRAPDDRDGTVQWSGGRAHPADVPEPPSAAANRGEAPLPGGRRGRSAGYERPAAPPRLMRRAPRPIGAPGRRRGGRGECGRQVRAGAGRAILAVVAQPVPSARHPMALGIQRPPVLGAQCLGTRGEGAASSRPRAVFIHNFPPPELRRFGAPKASARDLSARRCCPQC